MALEPAGTGFSISPTSSGRASPAPRNHYVNQKDDAQPKDKAYRRYAVGVDRALSLFDTAFQDWADYISFLGRLLKSLQAHPNNSTLIPSKALVAKRLSQCLSPELPGGVHQKALEVYSFIFALIGRETLSNELSIYLPGLSPTLSFASLSVRSLFLSLIEAHFLKLDSSCLRPALKALILALLPGLEEETSEDFERTLRIINAFKLILSNDNDSVIKYGQGDEYFWQCFFLASITSKSRRLGALAYMTRCLPRLGSPPSENTKDSTSVNDISFNESMVTSPEPGLLIRCFAAGLSDDQLLIQRGFLDLLVTHIPLHARVLHTRVQKADLELLILAASGVVIRRDMSLNRRLWSWLLGPELVDVGDGTGIESPSTTIVDPMADGVATRTRYFEDHGLRPLVQALLATLSRRYLNPIDRARPYRICLSLMDRWEIGGLVIPEIFMPVIHSVHEYERNAQDQEEFAEVLRSASVFFDGVESGLIWGELLSIAVHALQTPDIPFVDRMEDLNLIRFILAHFNVKEEEMLVIHAPNLALTILVMLDTSPILQDEKRSNPAGKLSPLIQSTLHIANSLIDLIPERAYRSTSQSSPSTHLNLDSTSIVDKLQKFYMQDQGNLDIADTPLDSNDLSHAVLETASDLVVGVFGTESSSADVSPTIQLFVSLLSRTPKTPGLDIQKILLAVQSVVEQEICPPFETFAATITLVISLSECQYITLQDMSSLLGALVNVAWHYLSPIFPKYHVEAARSLWQLQSVLTSENHDLEAALCRQIIGRDITPTIHHSDADPCHRFAILWGHVVVDNTGNLERRGSKSAAPVSTSWLGAYATMLGRPIFILLDALLDEGSQLGTAVRNWLQDLSGLERLFHLFVTRFAACGFLCSPMTAKDVNNTMSSETEEDDVDQCLYYLHTLSNVLARASPKTWSTLARNKLSTEKSYVELHRITGYDGEVSLLEFFAHVCLSAGAYCSTNPTRPITITRLRRIAFTVLRQILISSPAPSLSGLHLEHKLVELLHTSVVVSADDLLQISLLNVVSAALQLSKHSITPSPQATLPGERVSLQSMRNASKISLKLETPTTSFDPPAGLINCLQIGLSSPNCRSVLENWVTFLAEVLPSYSESIFQILIPLINTLCAQVSLVFDILRGTFEGKVTESDSAPESTLASLINGLEQVLARGHERLIKDESQISQSKSPDQAQGFFGTMVSGVFASDSPVSRSQNANNRLTVLLSFQDAIRISFSIWSWETVGIDDNKQDSVSLASFQYTSLRMRNRARRLLEHLFAAEALESLETVVDIWGSARGSDPRRAFRVFNLLHVLNGSRPKYTLPAIFDAIYSRTNPSVLEFSRRSTLTTDLRDVDLVVFLVSYAQSLEDDAMDEIWQDCMTFLRDILANPFPHRQILPNLLEFVSILGQKVDNTNFGEQKKMRRELGDLFLRLLAATFTTSPISFTNSNTVAQISTTEGDSKDYDRAPDEATDIVTILGAVVPSLNTVLVDPDRVLSAATAISNGIINPTIRSKAFPDNVTWRTLDLLYKIARLSGTHKAWKKDLSDAFNDSRFFGSSVGLVKTNWLPLLKQWTLSDKERMSELILRLTPPTTAGIVFGVGATSARLEADRKSQLNLRRIATLILAAATDHFVTELGTLEVKLVELLAATSTSSPSSTTRADIFMVLHALLLKISPIHLAPFWPIINAELHASISSIIVADASMIAETYNHQSTLQACRLLDVLLCISPDDFQLHEWLYITDTIDACHRPPNSRAVGLIDELAEELDSSIHTSPSHVEHTTSDNHIDKSRRRPLLGVGGIAYNKESLVDKNELVQEVLRPFFSQLSIFAFERTYEMGTVDWDLCIRALLTDLFDEAGIVKTL